MFDQKYLNTSETKSIFNQVIDCTRYKFEYMTQQGDSFSGEGETMDKAPSDHSIHLQKM